jgi:hypothetical protein
MMTRRRIADYLLTLGTRRYPSAGPFVLVGDTGIEPVTSTVSTRLVAVVRRCWVTLRAA